MEEHFEDMKKMGATLKVIGYVETKDDLNRGIFLTLGLSEEQNKEISLLIHEKINEWSEEKGP